MLKVGLSTITSYVKKAKKKLYSDIMNTANAALYIIGNREQVLLWGDFHPEYMKQRSHY